MYIYFIIQFAKFLYEICVDYNLGVQKHLEGKIKTLNIIILFAET